MIRALKVQFKIGLLMMLMAYSTYAALSISSPGTIQILAGWFGADATTVVPLLLMIGGAIIFFSAITSHILTAMQFTVLTLPLLFYIAASCIITYVIRAAPTAALISVVLYWIVLDDVRERT